MNIGGLSGTTSSSIKGFGGLASGLDRDSLIEGMTSGTTAKINKQQQKKTLLQWEQTAIRNITDKLTAFADKYTSTYASGTNLFSGSFWGRNQITALGANSKYVSVSGSANTADTLEIQRIKELAKKAQLTSSDRVSDSTLETGEIDLQGVQESRIWQERHWNSSTAARITLLHCRPERIRTVMNISMTRWTTQLTL